MAQTWRILVALLAASVALKSEAVSPEPWRSTPASAEGLEWAVSTAESPVPAPQPVLGPDAAALFAQDFFYAQRLQAGPPGYARVVGPEPTVDEALLPAEEVARRAEVRFNRAMLGFMQDLFNFTEPITEILCL
ncbi:Protein of unknown function [Gryllus bimaculatus]|nr:Protein of unknown function [Gryllus bimaculatus]